MSFNDDFNDKNKKNGKFISKKDENTDEIENEEEEEDDEEQEEEDDDEEEDEEGGNNAKEEIDLDEESESNSELSSVRVNVSLMENFFLNLG
jgi:hypothetical protein